MKKDLPLTLAATLGTIAAIQFPLVAPVATAALYPIKKLLDKRIKHAHKIALSEISDGRFNSMQKNNPEDFVAIAYRYHQAALEGAAKNNLRLLCRLIEGVPDLPPITASEFLHYASTISGLSNEELIVFSAIIRAENANQVGVSASSNDTPWATRNKVIDELTPQTLETKEDVAGVFTSLSRTGFVVESSGLDGGEWSTTSAGRKVEKLARLSTRPMTNNT